MPQPYMVYTQASDAEFYQRYAPAIFAYLLRNVGSREDAEDLLLDVFLAVLEKRQSAGVDEQRLATWIWVVVRNKTVDYHRRNKHRSHRDLHTVKETLYVYDAAGNKVWKKDVDASPITILDGMLYIESGRQIITYNIKSQQVQWSGQYGVDLIDKMGNHSGRLLQVIVVP